MNLEEELAIENAQKTLQVRFLVVTLFVVFIALGFVGTKLNEERYELKILRAKYQVFCKEGVK